MLVGGTLRENERTMRIAWAVYIDHLIQTFDGIITRHVENRLVLRAHIVLDVNITFTEDIALLAARQLQPLRHRCLIEG